MAKPASRPAKRGGSSIFTGVLIGLIVGAVLAVGVALWVTGNNPFQSDAAPAAAVKQAPAAAPEPAPSFDFYKVLPGDAGGELPATQPAAPDAPRYYLQVGAFQNADDADNLKAQLALLGLEALIQTGEVAGKGTLHRVRVGPFASEEDAGRSRAVLVQNNIPVTLVKEQPTHQEMP